MALFVPQAYFHYGFNSLRVARFVGECTLIYVIVVCVCAYLEGFGRGG